ncbi:hypothetical protein SDRG_05877 [Saprolegnia diclina VS20]|uniref:SGNH hydrolase-type esterase domain-containing protein n=1 Tax=Saprolegnia diclina (strain VS20) TaxID=1156394 RepID=T0QR92_SAPDV|nr:hypothetical protein SDRG_05877 [Saprolegnia diclina VS20]EQC36420.1 hypothetical protein SDRG_05877 [Saprolegnia diclina VS20]|eukprot:XP_008609841.1 hypothetical protein SDRG_05877 [Saprolegnia diclina VS20]
METPSTSAFEVLSAHDEPKEAVTPRRRWPWIVATVILASSTLALTIALCTQAEATSGRVTATILMVGDSNTELAANPTTQGFQALLSYDYSRTADVINRGVSGFTSSLWVARLDQLIAEWSLKPPSLITIMIGTNDAALPNSTLHVPIETYAANLRTLVQRLGSSFASTKFILLTPPVVESSAHWNYVFQNSAAEAYANRCKQVASDLNVPVIDLWTPLQGVPDVLYDGLHLTTTGNVFVHQQLLATIEASYPELAPTKLSRAYSNMP